MNPNHSDASRAPTTARSRPATRKFPRSPFADLTPERVLDALDSVLMPLGERTDGRMLAAQQLRKPRVSGRHGRRAAGGREVLSAACDGPTPPFSKNTLSSRNSYEREIPAVPARVLERHVAASPSTAFASRSSSAAAAARRISTAATRSNGSGASSGGFTRSAQIEPYRERPTLDIQTFGYEPREFLLTHGFVPARRARRV